MRLVIEAREFETLSKNTQQELLDRFAGKDWKRRTGSKEAVGKSEDLVDLTPTQAARLVETSSEKDRRLLRLFAQRGGRAKVDEILATGNDSDPEMVAHFVSAITSRVRAMLDEGSEGKGVFAEEPEPIEGTTTFRISELTTQSLRCFFPIL